MLIRDVLRKWLVVCERVADCLKYSICNPRLSFSMLLNLSVVMRGFIYAQKWKPSIAVSKPYPVPSSDLEPNPLKSYFDSHTEGRGVWKWVHYFDIYHHHFRKFVGREVHILEIGVYSGGSLELWRNYFGPRCHVYGVDIQESCKAYENEYTKIFIGDQGDRNFWKSVKKKAPRIDIIVDDGSHRHEHQIVTLEEMLPHLSSGGVYVCEDIHSLYNPCSLYLSGFIANLNANNFGTNDVKPENFQSEIMSMHFYPYVAVIEKNNMPEKEFNSLKHGTEWQPF